VGFDQAVDDAYPTPAATPEPTQIPQPGSTEFREAESDLLKTPPLFSEPSELKPHQEWWYKCEDVLEMIKQLTRSVNPHYPWDTGRMRLRGVNEVILKWNIRGRCPPQEALIDIDGLSSYYVRARLCRDIESFRMTIAQFTQYANTHHYPETWVKAAKASIEVRRNATQANLEPWDPIFDHLEDAGEEDEDNEEEDDEEEEEEEEEDHRGEPGYTPIGEKIIGHRKVNKDGMQLLVATGQQRCPLYQLLPAANYLKVVRDNYMACAHKQQLTGAEINGQYKGILHVAEEYSSPGALRKPVTFCLVEWHDKDPTWVSRTALRNHQKSRNGVDEAIEICKQRETTRREDFYRSRGISLPQPDYRHKLRERREARKREESNTFDPSSFPSFATWYEKQNGIQLAQNPAELVRMTERWTAIQNAMRAA